MKNVIRRVLQIGAAAIAIAAARFTKSNSSIIASLAFREEHGDAIEVARAPMSQDKNAKVQLPCPPLRQECESCANLPIRRRTSRDSAAPRGSR